MFGQNRRNLLVGRKATLARGPEATIDSCKLLGGRLIQAMRVVYTDEALRDLDEALTYIA